MFAITQLVASMALASSKPPVNPPIDLSPFTVPPLPAGPGACSAPCSVSTAGVCQPTLAAAIAAAASDGVVEIRDNVNVDSEIRFGKSLTIRGCNGRPTVTTSINVGEGGCMFRIIGDNNQRVTLSNLVFQNGESNLATVLRTPDLGVAEWPEEPSPSIGPIALIVENCDFSNFKTSARGGSVFFLSRARLVNIGGSRFERNQVLRNGRRWLGGGAVWVTKLEGNALVWGNTFSNNVHNFEHGYGAAIYVEDMYNKVKIVGNTFERNSAAGGAAIFLNNIGNNGDDELTIDSKFYHNMAPEYGWGPRGGAMWLHDINCKVRIRGEFVNNTSPEGRGAIVASNLVSPKGNIEISGTYRENVAKIGGWLFDTRGDIGFAPGAQLTVHGETVMEGNVGNGTADNKMVVYSAANNVNYTTFPQARWSGRTTTFYART